jgi:hypothetical protein
MRVVGAVLCVLLGGCLTTQYSWTEPDYTPAGFATDRYECLQQSQQSYQHASVGEGGGYSNAGMTTNMTLFGACMSARGYTLVAQQVGQ